MLLYEWVDSSHMTDGDFHDLEVHRVSVSKFGMYQKSALSEETSHLHWIQSIAGTDILTVDYWYSYHIL